MIFLIILYNRKMATEIYVPALPKDSFVTSYAQMRPFREGGNVLERV